MDLGAEMMEQVTPALSHSRWMAAAPALPPLPPTTNSMSMAHMSMRFTISLMSAPPLEVPCSMSAFVGKSRKVQIALQSPHGHYYCNSIAGPSTDVKD